MFLREVDAAFSLPAWQPNSFLFKSHRGREDFPLEADLPPARELTTLSGYSGFSARGGPSFGGQDFAHCGRGEILPSWLKSLILPPREIRQSLSDGGELTTSNDERFSPRKAVSV